MTLKANTATLQEWIDIGIAEGHFDGLDAGENVNALAEQFGIDDAVIRQMVKERSMSRITKKSQITLGATLHCAGLDITFKDGTKATIFVPFQNLDNPHLRELYLKA